MPRTLNRQRNLRWHARVPSAKVCLRGAFLLTALMCCYAAVAAQQTRTSAYQVEAVYLFNFSKFVQWPAHAVAPGGEPFGICVLGTDPFGAALDATVSGENVAGRSLVAKRISKPQDASACRILFVSSSEESRLKEILSTLGGASVLTVSDIPKFSQRGGMIQFVPVDGKVRFEVNVKNASNAGLSLSSDLLQVALAVRTDS